MGKTIDWIKKHWIISSFIGLILLGMIFSASKGDNYTSNNSQADTSEDWRESIELRDACYISHQFVEKELKAPRTAKWESCFDATIIEGTNQTYTVSSYVDSENSFSALIRTNYIATLRPTDREDYWTLVDLIFE